MISVVQRNERVGEEGKKFKFQLLLDEIMTQKSQEHIIDPRRRKTFNSEHSHNRNLKKERKIMINYV